MVLSAVALLAGAVWFWPVTGPVATPFQAPTHAFGPGHRGIDIVAATGAEVHAAHGGTVTFAGPVGGVGTISVRLGRVLTTYQPVHPGVTVGTRVDAGTPIGTLISDSCRCLHFGVRIDGEYRDPLRFLRPTAVLKSSRMP